MGIVEPHLRLRSKSEFRAARQLAMPQAITVEMAKSFFLYLVKVVLNGLTDEVIDLARTNLWR
jgi:hypothetical protein